MATKTKTKTRSTTTAFTIEVPLTQKQLSKVAELSLIELEDFAPETLKAAGVSIKSLKSELMQDAAFRSAVSKEATKVLRDYLSYAVDEFMIMNENHPLAKSAYRACEKIADRVDAEQDKRREEHEIRLATQMLESKGFIIMRR